MKDGLRGDSRWKKLMDSKQQNIKKISTSRGPTEHTARTPGHPFSREFPGLFGGPAFYLIKCFDQVPEIATNFQEAESAVQAVQSTGGQLDRWYLFQI